MDIKVCIGSSCHLKGSYDIVELLKKSISESGVEAKINLSGCFCLDKCNHSGVSIQVDDEVVTGVTTTDFPRFWQEKVIKKLQT